MLRFKFVVFGGKVNYTCPVLLWISSRNITLSLLVRGLQEGIFRLLCLFLDIGRNCTCILFVDLIQEGTA